MLVVKKIAEIEYLHHEFIDFDLDRPGHPDNLIYYFTRQRRGPHMNIEAIDRMGFCAAVITEGQAVFEHLGQTVQLRQGSVFLRRHNLPYRFYKTDPDELTLTMIMFDPSIEPLWNRLIEPDCISVQLCNTAKVVELADTFFDLLIRNPDRRIERANAFAPFFLETVMAEKSRESNDRNPAKDLAESCRHYLHENFSRIRNMDAVAQACHISRNHLYDLFRDHIQTTPKEYLDRLKTSAAADLLAQTDWTMEHIAEETGYADAPTFSKAFKRRNGVSPAEWRQNAKGVAH